MMGPSENESESMPLRTRSLQIFGAKAKLTLSSASMTSPSSSLVAEFAARHQEEVREKQKQVFAKLKKAGSEMVMLNVGGTVFTTSRSTLLEAAEGTPLQIMFSGDHGDAVAADDDSYFLDRDPEVFKYVLNYLRALASGQNPLTITPDSLGVPARLVIGVTAEAEVFELEGMVIAMGSAGRTPQGESRKMTQCEFDALYTDSINNPQLCYEGTCCDGSEGSMHYKPLRPLKLRGLNLGGLCFRGYDLRGADFTHCNIVGCDFSYADLGEYGYAQLPKDIHVCLPNAVFSSYDGRSEGAIWTGCKGSHPE